MSAADRILLEAAERLAPEALELACQAVKAILGGQRRSAARLAKEAADVQLTRLQADAELAALAALEPPPAPAPSSPRPQHRAPSRGR